MTRTSYGADAIAYARGDGGGHNGAKARNDYVAGVNMLPDNVVPFERQMQPFWNKADPRHKTQIDRFIVSFSPDELNPDNPEDLVKALDIGCRIARENAPDSQSAVYVQTDGAGHKVHLHILTNDVKITDYKGLDSRAYFHVHFRQIVDKICEEYFDLKKAELLPERTNPAVRGARIKNEQIRTENAREIQLAAAEGRAVDQRKIKAEKYIWQDDLRQRIKNAAQGAADEAGFARCLRLDGVELVPHKAKDGTLSYLHPATKKQPAHYTYELIDVSGFSGKIPPNLRSKSFKLGADYQPEGVAQLFQKQAPAAVQPRRVPVAVPDQPKEKPPEKSPGAVRQDPELERVKAAARAHMKPILQRTIPGADADDMFERFTRWRDVRRIEEYKAGRKFPPIYHKDAQGKGSVLYDRLEAQYTDFLTETRQAEAERQRQLLWKQREALSAEVRRTAEYIAERRRSQTEGPDYTGR